MEILDRHTLYHINCQGIFSDLWIHLKNDFLKISDEIVTETNLIIIEIDEQIYLPVRTGVYADNEKEYNI